MFAAIGVLEHFRALSALDQYLDGRRDQEEVSAAWNLRRRA
jgi:hypothetical protein